MSENNEIPKTGTYPDMMEWLGLLAEYYPGHASGQRAQCALDTIQALEQRIAELDVLMKDREQDLDFEYNGRVKAEKHIAELEAQVEYHKAEKKEAQRIANSWLEKWQEKVAEGATQDKRIAELAAALGKAVSRINYYLHGFLEHEGYNPPWTDDYTVDSFLPEGAE